MSSQKPSQQSNGEAEVKLEKSCWTPSDLEYNKKLGVLMIHENCDKSLASDKSLPLNSYIVTYEYKGKVCYDIVQSNAIVKIFDCYYDKLGIGTAIKSIKWTDGRVNPKLYGNRAKPETKKRRSED